MERQKILHWSAERSAKLVDISTENKGIPEAETAGSKVSMHNVENFVKTKMENGQNNASASASNVRTCTIVPGATTMSTRAEGTKDAKRPFYGSNYFDRYSSTIHFAFPTN